MTYSGGVATAVRLYGLYGTGSTAPEGLDSYVDLVVEMPALHPREYLSKREQKSDV